MAGGSDLSWGENQAANFLTELGRDQPFQDGVSPPRGEFVSILEDDTFGVIQHTMVNMQIVP